MSVAKGVGYGILGTVLDALAPEEGLNPVSYAVFIICALIIAKENIPAWAKVVLILALVWTILLSEIALYGMIPGVEGLDTGVVMGIAGLMAGAPAGAASFLRVRR